jgi:hypothetical protein
MTPHAPDDQEPAPTPSAPTTKSQQDQSLPLSTGADGSSCPYCGTAASTADLLKHQLWCIHDIS